MIASEQVPFTAEGERDHLCTVPESFQSAPANQGQR